MSGGINDFPIKMSIGLMKFKQKLLGIRIEVLFENKLGHKMVKLFEFRRDLLSNAAFGFFRDRSYVIEMVEGGRIRNVVESTELGKRQAALAIRILSDKTKVKNLLYWAKNLLPEPQPTASFIDTLVDYIEVRRLVYQGQVKGFRCTITYHSKLKTAYDFSHDSVPEGPLLRALMGSYKEYELKPDANGLLSTLSERQGAVVTDISGDIDSIYRLMANVNKDVMAQELYQNRYNPERRK
jgi:hypothetical protein